MKRALSLLLSVVFLFSCLSFQTVYAVESGEIITEDMVALSDAGKSLSSAEEVLSSAEDAIVTSDINIDFNNLETQAATPSGYFAASGVNYTEFTQDFEATTPISPVYSTTAKDSLGFGYERPNQHTYTYSTKDYPLGTSGSGSKYLTLSTVNKASRFIGGYYGIADIAANEKVHMSFEFLLTDYDSDKSVYFTWRNAVNSWESILGISKTGVLTFGSSSVTYPYSLNRWYKIDVVVNFDHGVGNNSGTHDTYIYLNGNLMATMENRGNYQTQSGVSYYSPSGVRFSIGNSSGSGESVFCIDNIKGKIYSASETVPTLVQDKFAYTNFDIPANASSADAFSGSGVNSIVDYAVTKGVFGKEAYDSSMKIITNIAVSGAAYDSNAGWSANNPSVNAYVFSTASIKPNNSFPVGSQLKASFSYAFKKHTPTGGGGDYFQLGGTAYGENFFTIGRTGTVSAAGGSKTFTLGEEKWYNFDVIMTVNAEKALDYVIYINGIAEIEGTLNIASLKNDNGAVINNIRFLTYMSKGTVAETYLDDMYIEYFTGVGEDNAQPNEAIINTNVDTRENGKIFVPAGYSAADILADTQGNVKVLRGNVSVTSGTAEGVLVVVGTLCPVYAYSNIKIKLYEPTYVYSDGNLDIEISLESHQSDPVDITLVATVYEDGRVKYVKSKSQQCSEGTTTVKLEDLSFPGNSKARIFTLEGWNTKLPLFGDQVYEISYDDLVYERPTAEMLSQSYSDVHPKVILNSSKVNEIKNSTDTTVTDWKASVIADANDALTAPVYDYSKYSTGEMKNIGESMDRVMDLGLAYLLTSDTRYSDRAYTEVNEFLQMTDWNTQSYLDVAEISVIVSIAYDWMYSAWTQTQKEAMSEKLLNAVDYTNKLYKGQVPDPNGWLHVNNNWNAVCNGGMAIASMAVMTEDTALCSEVLKCALEDLEYLLPEFAPYGDWKEGPAYWAYTMKYLTALCASLQNTYSTDFGISKTSGLKESAMYAISLEGKTGTMNIGDTSTAHIFAPEMFYWSSFYNMPEVAGAAKWTMSQYGFNPDTLSLIYYDPTNVTSYTKPLSTYFRGGEIVSFESGSSLTDTFIGMAGGLGITSHGHLDSGSVILDMKGTRFISDIGAEHYGKTGYFSTKRYLYYKARPEGHNLFVINPLNETDGSNVYYGQKKDAFSAVTSYDNTLKKATLDLSEAYSRDASYAARTISLEGSKAVIDDEIRLLKQSEIRWYFHTDANIAISGNTATLTKDGKTITLTFDAGYNVGTLKISPAQRLNATTEVTDTPVTSYQKLEFVISNASGLVNVKVTAQ
ncbi:MAG: heparinase II/III family protein [Clostridia bacterium]|nr:heparinase II/III family protein [Clostridia bacterium]